MREAEREGGGQGVRKGIGKRVEGKEERKTKSKREEGCGAFAWFFFGGGLRKLNK